MYLSYQNNKIVGYTEQPQDLTLYNLDKVEYTEDEYVLDGDCYVLKDEAYEEKQAQAEAERIAKLNLTGADVERGIYQAKGMDFDDIINLVTHLSQGEIDLETGEVINRGTNIDVKALKIELKANHFYRGNPYVDAVGVLLGFTKEQLDKFFEFNDYTYLLPSEQVENTSEQVTEQVEETEDENTTNIES